VLASDLWCSLSRTKPWSEWTQSRPSKPLVLIVIEAIDADHAIPILEQRSDICLIFTDIHMPGSMDGLKLAHFVKDRWPAYRHGIRAAELVDLRWDQINFDTANLAVRRAKKGSPSTHPIRGDELRALRRLNREQEPKSAFRIAAQSASRWPGFSL
jgi:integrase